MRTRHDLLDVSTYSGQHFTCSCGHWNVKAVWQEALNAPGLFHEHVQLWDEAEADLDEVEPFHGRPLA